MIGGRKSPKAPLPMPEPWDQPQLPEPFEPPLVAAQGPSAPDPLEWARAELAQARAAQEARTRAEEAEAEAARQKEQRDAEARRALIDAETEAIRSAAADVARIEAEIEAARIAELREATEAQDAAQSLWARAAQARQHFATYDLVGLPAAVLGRVVLRQVTNLDVPEDLWTQVDPLVAEVDCAGARWRVVNGPEPVLFVTDGAGGLYPVFTMADVAAALPNKATAS